MAAYTTIDDPSAYFKVQLYTGDGSNDRGIVFDDTDTDMQPDFVWIKNRETPDQHELFDAIRGVTKELNSATSDEELTDPDTLTDFDSDGFTVDDDFQVNTNTEKYVAWCWKANGSGSANTAGSINTTATSVESTAKFSINTYDGTGSNATIGHGLSAVPGFFLVKKTSGNVDWGIYHHRCATDPETDYGILNTTAAWSDNNGQWNDTAPTSTLISIGTNGECNASGGEYVIYAWSEIQGFSKFGAYEGNGNADGTFVYLGFRPAWLLIMNADSSGSDKYIFDYKRAGYNVQNNRIGANENGAESTDVRLDLLSNGFKVRNTGNPNNTDTWVYAAFAEAPFVNSNGVPCNAR